MAHQFERAVRILYPDLPHSKVQNSHCTGHDHAKQTVCAVLPDTEHAIHVFPPIPQLPEIFRRVLSVAVGLENEFSLGVKQSEPNGSAISAISRCLKRPQLGQFAR